MRLGKTSGWVHRATLKDKNVQMLRGVSYERVDDTGLTIRRPDGAPRLLEVDHVVLCAGQEPLRELEEALLREHIPVHRIGGADVAAELDAKRAIRQATLLALSI
jgi:2,4-dienoyl-CoA reductase (NADPH2)